NYRLIYQNGAPFQIEVWNNPAYAKVVTHYLGTYVTDGWNIGRRLTLNLGIRFAHDNGFVPGSCVEAADPPGNIAFPATCYQKQQFNVWNTFAPRLHAVWDLSSDGRTLIKGGWGRFDHQRQQVPELDSADAQVRTTVTYRWRDLNGNRNCDPGEVNLNTNGPDFLSQSGGSNTVPIGSELEPKSDELSLSLERELRQNFGLRVSGIYSRYRNVYRTVNLLRLYNTYNIPVTNTDPGPDGVGEPRVQRQRRKRAAQPERRNQRVGSGVGVQREGLGCVRTAAPDPRVRQLRAAQRLSVGASGAVHRRLDDPELHDERRADRRAAA